MRKRAAVFMMLTAATIGVSACGTNDTAKAAPQQLNIGTASMGGAFYPFGQGIANLDTQYADGLTMTPEVTGGAVENCRLVSSKEVDFALTNENHAYAATMGEEPFEEKENLCVVARLYPSVLHIIVPEDSDINSIEDLKGKRIAVGPAGGGTIAPLEAVFEEYGMTAEDMVPSYLSYSDGFTQLADGNVDAALALSGYPASAVMEYSSTKTVKFVNIDDDKFEAIMEKRPYYNKVEIPADVYKMKEPGLALGINNVLITRPDMDEEVVYKVTSSLFVHLEEFQETNATAKMVSIENAVGSSVEMHPGARRYFDEKLNGK